MTEQDRKVITVIMVATPGAPIQIAVSCGIAAATRTISDARREQTSASFTQPFTDLHVVIDEYALERIVMLIEQEVNVIKDPRQVGLSQTPSGIQLPPRN
jgi:hypothetical protein